METEWRFYPKITGVDNEKLNDSPRPDVGRDLAATGIMDLQREDQEQNTLPPAEAIPSLFERGVKGPDSLHQHKYNQDNTVWAKFSEAEDTPQDERTEEQTNLINNVKHLEEYAGYATTYMDVFTPDELAALVSKLDLLRGRDRSNFDSVEAEIINVIQKNQDSMPSDVKRVVNREKISPTGRQARQLGTLNKLAEIADKALISNLFHDDERRRYIVPVRQDPDVAQSDTKLDDLKNVYQFVATSHAFDIHGKRSNEIATRRLETFLENCDIITTWYKEAESNLDQLPRTVDFADSLIEQTSSLSARRKPARSSIQFDLKNLIQTMISRRDSNESFGKNKSYKVDPTAAINLQLVICHKIEALRAKLDTGVHPDDEEIVPLD